MKRLGFWVICIIVIGLFFSTCASAQIAKFMNSIDFIQGIKLGSRIDKTLYDNESEIYYLKDTESVTFCSSKWSAIAVQVDENDIIRTISYIFQFRDGVPAREKHDIKRRIESNIIKGAKNEQ